MSVWNEPTVIVVIWLVFIAGIFIGLTTKTSSFSEQDAIDRGHARYNPTNAKFEWIEGK
jgi:hypothetical protein